jgi:hypothetical protein
VRAKTFRSCGPMRYDWSIHGTITLTVVERDALAPGSGMTMTATPNSAGGTSVHAVWDHTSKNLSALLGLAMRRVIGPRYLASYFKKV